VPAAHDRVIAWCRLVDENGPSFGQRPWILEQERLGHGRGHAIESVVTLEGLTGAGATLFDNKPPTHLIPVRGAQWLVWYPGRIVVRPRRQARRRTGRGNRNSIRRPRSHMTCLPFIGRVRRGHGLRPGRGLRTGAGGVAGGRIGHGPSA